jgi:cytochrome c553
VLQSTQGAAWLNIFIDFYLRHKRIFGLKDACALQALTPEVVLPDATRMSKGQALAQQHKCMLCHGAVLDGGQGVPRIGGQKEDDVRATLHGFKSGERLGYTRAMSEALSQVPVEDLNHLACYVAYFTGA